MEACRRDFDAFCALRGSVGLCRTLRSVKSDATQRTLASSQVHTFANKGFRANQGLPDWAAAGAGDCVRACTVEQWIQVPSSMPVVITCLSEGLALRV